MTPRGALIRHDALLCRNTLRTAHSGWLDRATLLIGVPLLLLTARAALEPADGRSLALFGGATGIVAGYFLARLAQSRLHYHRTEGVLVVRALERGPALRYSSTLFAIGSAAIASLVAFAALPAVPWFVMALFGGATLSLFAGLLSSRVRFSSTAGSLARKVGSWLDRPMAGLLLAIPIAAIGAVAVALLSSRDAIAIAATATAAGGLMLAHIDAAKVRFMAQAGHSTRAGVGREVRPLAIYTIAIGAAAVPAFGAIEAAIVIAVPIALLLLQPIRVMLCRAYDRRAADWLFTAILAGLALAWFTVPFVAPFAHAAILWWTARHTRPARWRIA